MKLICYLLILLLLVGLSCASSKNYYNCSNIEDLNNYCDNVEIKSKLIGVWKANERGGATYSQWEISIVNKLGFDITQIYIYKDYTLKIRDRKSIWNIGYSVENSNILILSQQQSSINSGNSFVFGFIIQDIKPVNLKLLAISF